jgi:hypothetical protein
MKKFITTASLSFLLVSPFALFAQVNPDALAQEPSSISTGCSGIKSLDGVVDCVSGFFNAAIYLLMSFALLYTVWSALQFIRADGEGRDEWRSKIVAGIIGLFVMSAIWGLVGILSGTFRLSNTPVTPPSIQIPK